MATTDDCHETRFENCKFWVEFALFDDGLEADRAAALVPPTLCGRFHRFPDLPPELRLKVWGYMIRPRIVTACCLERSAALADRRAELARRSQPRRRPRKDDVSNLSSSAAMHHHPPPPPVLLLISRETRHLALSHYVPAFSWRISALLSDTPVARPAAVWFNFTLDALYLTGELEAYDQYGFNSPMVYFFRKEDTCRVRHVACPFRELHYPEQESDQVFGCLWHVIDRFPAAARLLLTVAPGDAEAAAAAPGIPGGVVLGSTDNVIQKIWNGWVCGTTITGSSLANKQIMMVAEEELAEFVGSQS